MWIDETKLMNMDFWKLASRLLFLYLMMVAVFTNIDKVVRHPAMAEMVSAFFRMFDGANKFDILKSILSNWFYETIILQDMPGRSCRHLGSRTGFALRKLLTIRMRDIGE